MIDLVQYPANDRPRDEAGVGAQIASDRAKRRLHPAGAKSQVILDGADYCGAGLDVAIPRLQLLHPVRQTEDLGPDDAVEVGIAGICGDEGLGRLMIDLSNTGIVSDEGPDVLTEPVLLQLACAANPFDFWPLIERGFAEWSRTGDALLDGAPFPGALDLFRDGLGSGRFDLFLGMPAIEEVLGRAISEQEPLFQDLRLEGLINQCPDTGPLHPAIPGENGGVDPLRIGPAQQPAKPLLYDIVSVFHGYLQGHLLWVAPEYRGRGLVGQYFDAALAVAKRHGLNGFMFLSTLPLWERRAPRYGFEARGCIRQPNGPDVVGWFREVC